MNQDAGSNLQTMEEDKNSTAEGNATETPKKGCPGWPKKKRKVTIAADVPKAEGETNRKGGKKTGDKAEDAKVLEAVVAWTGERVAPESGEAWREFVKRRLPEVRKGYLGQPNAVHFKSIGQEWKDANT